MQLRGHPVPVSPLLGGEGQRHLDIRGRSVSGRKCPQGRGEHRDDRDLGTGERECSSEGAVVVAWAWLIVLLREGCQCCQNWYF